MTKRSHPGLEVIRSANDIRRDGRGKPPTDPRRYRLVRRAVANHLAFPAIAGGMHCSPCARRGPVQTHRRAPTSVTRRARGAEERRARCSRGRLRLPMWGGEHGCDANGAIGMNRLSDVQGPGVTGRVRPGDDPAGGSWPWWWQAALGAVVAAYCLSLVVVGRPKSGYATLWDGWLGNIAGGLPVVPVLWRVRRMPRLRVAWQAMAAGIALNKAADLVYLCHDQNVAPIPNPAPSDALYLLSMTAFVVGVALMTQQAFGRGHASVRLDGIVAGLAGSAVAVMVWFEPVLRISGNPFQVGVGMAYPLFDLVLMVLLVAGLAPQRYRPTWATGLLMVGVGWFVVGDVIYLNQTSAGTYVAGTPLEATWVIGIFLMGVAAWARDERRVPSRTAAAAPAGIAAVPVVCGAVALGVLGVSLVRQTSAVALGMAIAALGVVIVRMAFTLREVRRAALSFHDARTDELTGLANRRAFLEHVGERLGCSSDTRRVGVLLIDLDGFKEVNDSLGHHSGDELLRIVAERFGRQVERRAVVARLGGDEFACAARIGSQAELVAIAHELAATLDEPMTLEGVAVRVGASIGVAISPDHGATPAELLRSADVAMYDSKGTQAVVCVYDVSHDLNSRERLGLIQELRVAIDTRALTLHYQPTLALRTSTVRGLEALVRWNHPTRGLLGPDEFIPLAERVGLIPSLTRAVLDLAVAEAARLDRAGHRLQMSVNISRYDLVDEHLPTYIDTVLARHGVLHHRLTLEVTESCLGDDPERAKRCIEELRSRGVRIAIDDFGVGYSSMSQLLELPIDELKIDKSFIAALAGDRRAGAIISSTVQLGRALNLDIVAEGVETAVTLGTLRRLGTDIGQGYHIARPLTPDQLDDYLADAARGDGLRAEPIRPGDARAVATAGPAATAPR